MCVLDVTLSLNMTRKKGNMTRENENAAVFLIDFKCFQAKGEGSYLEGNDQALSAESLKSNKKITQ